jgi:hypothetical protein
MVDGLIDTLVQEFDTLMASTTYLFIANDAEAEHYSWQFGSDPRIFSGRQVSLAFDCDVAGQSIAVTLIAERLRDSVCVAAHLLRDTVRKVLHFVPQWESKLQGRFEGYLSDRPEATFEIELQLLCDERRECRCQGEQGDVYLVYNLGGHGCWQRGGGGIRLQNRSGSFRIMRAARTEDGCIIPEGYNRASGQDAVIFLSFPAGDSIYIEFTRTLSSTLPPYPYLKERLTFRGVRI